MNPDDTNNRTTYDAKVTELARLATINSNAQRNSPPAHWRDQYNDEVASVRGNLNDIRKDFFDLVSASKEVARLNSGSNSAIRLFFCSASDNERIKFVKFIRAETFDQAVSLGIQYWQGDEVEELDKLNNPSLTVAEVPISDGEIGIVDSDEVQFVHEPITFLRF